MLYITVLLSRTTASTYNVTVCYFNFWLLRHHYVVVCLHSDRNEASDSSLIQIIVSASLFPLNMRLFIGKRVRNNICAITLRLSTSLCTFSNMLLFSTDKLLCCWHQDSSIHHKGNNINKVWFNSYYGDDAICHWKIALALWKS